MKQFEYVSLKTSTILISEKTQYKTNATVFTLVLNSHFLNSGDEPFKKRSVLLFSLTAGRSKELEWYVLGSCKVDAMPFTDQRITSKISLLWNIPGGFLRKQNRPANTEKYQVNEGPPVTINIQK